jgi:hypothetical protein
MSRIIYDTTGTDVTATVKALLTATPSAQLFLADLFWLESYQFWGYNPSYFTSSLFLTSYDKPVAVTKLQQTATGLATVNALYQPTAIERGQLEYKIGLDSQTLDLTWYVNDKVPWLIPTAQGFGGSSPTLKQCAIAGYFDECPVWFHRAFFSGPPPLTFLGTMLMFRGYIREVEATRDYLKFTLTSLLDLFQETDIPTQRLEPGNRLASQIPTGTNFNNTTFQPGSSTPTDLVFQYTGSTIPDHILKDAFLISAGSLGSEPTSAAPPFVAYRVQDNVTTNTPFTNALHVYPYEPVLGTVGVAIYGVPPIDGTAGLPPGFPYVPPPESGV